MRGDLHLTDEDGDGITFGSNNSRGLFIKIEPSHGVAMVALSAEQRAQLYEYLTEGNKK